MRWNRERGGGGIKLREEVVCYVCSLDFHGEVVWNVAVRKRNFWWIFLFIFVGAHIKCSGHTRWNREGRGGVGWGGGIKLVFDFLVFGSSSKPSNFLPSEKKIQVICLFWNLWATRHRQLCYYPIVFIYYNKLLGYPSTHITKWPHSLHL